jgi:hypothetical protein
MKRIEKKIYQILDKDCNYRSCITFKGEPLDFICKERTKAIVYTYDEAKKIAKYYIEERNIPVMIECRTVYSKKEI